jgi:hypothetical protein
LNSLNRRQGPPTIHSLTPSLTARRGPLPSRHTHRPPPLTPFSLSHSSPASPGHDPPVRLTGASLHCDQLLSTARTPLPLHASLDHYPDRFPHLFFSILTWLQEAAEASPSTNTPHRRSTPPTVRMEPCQPPTTLLPHLTIGDVLPRRISAERSPLSPVLGELRPAHLFLQIHRCLTALPYSSELQRPSPMTGDNRIFLATAECHRLDMFAPPVVAPLAR